MAKTIRADVRIVPDVTRLVARPFIPGSTNFAGTAARLDAIAKRVIETPPSVRKAELDRLRRDQIDSIENVEATWTQNFEVARNASQQLAETRDDDLRLILGAYFTQLFAHEAVAITNPSIVPIGEPESGRQRFAMSTRSIGEGHLSSIGFITGSVDGHGNVTLDERSRHVSTGDRRSPTYSRDAFRDKLSELGFLNESAGRILDRLPEDFDTERLESVIRTAAETDILGTEFDDAVKRMHWLAASNYQLAFRDDQPISEHLIVPAAPAESRGLEDARFVRFVDEDGSVVYYATYTAYDGFRILSQLIETPDFHRFRMATMSGPAGQHKGMALFPRRVGGELMALSRHDNESTYLLRGDHMRRWSNAELILRPERDWEAVQTGNCGSPLETEAGWLMITHGVGPMRRYVLGAVLLDLDEPSKVLGRLPSPWLEPEDDERFGYVPNVVYSCGSMIHAGNLITPFGYSDVGIKFAVTSLDSLLSDMVL